MGEYLGKWLSLGHQYYKMSLEYHIVPGNKENVQKVRDKGANWAEALVPKATE